MVAYEAAHSPRRRAGLPARVRVKSSEGVGRDLLQSLALLLLLAAVVAVRVWCSMPAGVPA